MTGTLHIVGVGPGDPELITVKAARLIAAAQTVAFFCKHGRPGHARRTAAAYITDQSTQLRFEYPFTTEVELHDPRYLTDMAAFYEHCATALAARLETGESIVLLCEGDPFFYGSAMYLHDRLHPAHQVEIIPGVTGMSGCWSRAGTPITHGDDVLSVLPGTLSEEALAERLVQCDAAVIMKLGRNLPKIRAAIARANLTHRAIYVERGTMQDEILHPLAALTRDQVPYFALILIPGRQNAR